MFELMSSFRFGSLSAPSVAYGEAKAVWSMWPHVTVALTQFEANAEMP